jgi:hypothetical protein
MQPMFRAWAALAIPVLMSLSPACVRADVLDPEFGIDGLEVLTQTLTGFVPLGSCPHANGSVSIVAHRSDMGLLATVRLRAQGGLDTRFSDDGVHQIFMGSSALQPAYSAASCTGVGNIDPEDDRMLIAVTAPGTSDRTWVALIDLETGSWNPDFYLGGPAVLDLSGLTFPPTGEVWPYPRTRIRGAFPSGDGGWIVTGQFAVDEDVTPPVGFVAKLGAIGSVDAITHPNMQGFVSEDLVGARLGADGDFRIFGSFRRQEGRSWGLMRLDGTSLTVEGMSDYGEASNGWFRVFRARNIGGGVMLGAGLIADDSAIGTAPQLFIVRGDSVDVMELPAAPDLDGGVAVGGSAAEGSVAATGATGNRAVFSMGLRSADNPGAGYYTAVVQLGDGADVADTMDTRFGTGGVASFAFHNDSGCAPGQVPEQTMSGISSWGIGTTLVGMAAPACGVSRDSILVARIRTDPETIFTNRFE